MEILLKYSVKKFVTVQTEDLPIHKIGVSVLTKMWLSIYKIKHENQLREC